MKRILSRHAFVACSAASIVLLALVAAQGQLPGQQDPERGFSFGDTNLDNRLTLDEFKELLRALPRQKAAQNKATPALMDGVFRRLDANDDGWLSLSEYRRIGTLRPGGGGPGMPGGGGFGPFAKGGMLKKQANAAPAGPRPKAPNPQRTEPTAAAPITAEQTRFFESKIRPVLVSKCAGCHAAGAEKVKGGLLVDSREGLLRGGDTGPAVVPGNLDESLLITAIHHSDEGLKMPPKGKLSDEVIADFETWIKMGAPDPRRSPRSSSSASAAGAPGLDLKKARNFWAFQPPKAFDPPQVENQSWPKTDLDRFVLARLEQKGLKPVADADRSTWLRRVTFDLIGLPPTPEEISAYLADTSADADEKVVDRLLGSLRFGERWGRHWLDVARFAESSGKVNMLYPQAWRYRDYVIAAFNNDKPYHQFVQEQIAGDLLPAPDEPTRAAQIIATGFLAMGSKNHNTQNRRQFVLDLADEQIDTTSQAFLGLTVACARCHDHKFDPIPQRDYYALSGIFQSTQNFYGTLPGLIQNINPSPLIELPDSAHQSTAVPPLPPGRRAPLEAQLAELIKARDALTPDENISPKGFQTRARLAILRFRLASYKEDGSPRTYAMGVGERDEPVNSPLYVRGELDQAAEAVPRGLLQVLSKDPRSATIKSRGSGRKELAQWLGSTSNPLTARVMVNRVWLHLFGKGIVASADNFGVAGQPPTHPELLDTLAVRFMDNGWSVKKLIRDVVLSRTYHLASMHDERNFEVDPDNALLWRMSKKRLEAEAIRDAVLAVSGRLTLTPPVGSPVAMTGEGLAQLLRNANVAQDLQETHRAVYLAVVRDQVPDSLAVFDFADPSLVTGERSSTSGPAQSLYLMNNPFLLRNADAAAARLIEASEDTDERVKTAYQLFVGRVPTPTELERARQFVKTFGSSSLSSSTSATNPGQTTTRAPWAALCQALYASAEFRYLD